MKSDAAPFTRHGRSRRFPALLVCDHASRAIPAPLGNLGLSAQDRERHIAWDIGALALARCLADYLSLGLISASWSRLVIDCNRHLDDATSIVTMSDGTPVPGNQGLSAHERSDRVQRYFEPYHDAIAQELEQLATQPLLPVPTPAPVLIAIHSFTPSMGGVARPWNCGILWDRDPRLPVPLMAALAQLPGVVVGDNQPYSGRHPEDYTIERHAELHGRAHVCIEIRQDQLHNEAGVVLWADRLAQALTPLLSQPSLYRAAEPYQPVRSARGAK